MKKHLWKDILVIIGSLIASYIVFYFIFTNMRVFSYVGITGILVLEIVFAYSIYTAYKLITEKANIKKYLRIFLFLYIGLYITLLFSRSNPIFGINLRIGYINDYAPYILWVNLLILAPVGYLVRNLYEINSLLAIPAAVTSVIFLEFLQYILRRGCFDINDIFFNGMGFVIGIIFWHIYNKLKNRLTEQA